MSVCLLMANEPRPVDKGSEHFSAWFEMRSKADGWTAMLTFCDSLAQIRRKAQLYSVLALISDLPKQQQPKKTIFTTKKAPCLARSPRALPSLVLSGLTDCSLRASGKTQPWLEGNPRKKGSARLRPSVRLFVAVSDGNNGPFGGCSEHVVDVLKTASLVCMYGLLSVCFEGIVAKLEPIVLQFGPFEGCRRAFLDEGVTGFQEGNP
uniref:Uncharacterized protein n=1 Tax=Panagrellus redivivus TaxID=6233 RepID=A0A7E4WDB4_PANRE